MSYRFTLLANYSHSVCADFFETPVFLQQTYGRFRLERDQKSSLRQGGCRTQGGDLSFYRVSSNLPVLAKSVYAYMYTCPLQRASKERRRGLVFVSRNVANMRRNKSRLSCIWVKTCKRHPPGVSGPLGPPPCLLMQASIGVPPPGGVNEIHLFIRDRSKSKRYILRLV